MGLEESVRYNTTVLHLNKGSASGSFLFRTASKNGSRYTRDTHLEELLRLPDALFESDAAWLYTEFRRRDRLPQPYFQCVVSVNDI